MHPAVKISCVHVVFNGPETTGDRTNLRNVPHKTSGREYPLVDFSLRVRLSYQLIVLFSRIEQLVSDPPAEEIIIESKHGLSDESFRLLTVEVTAGAETRIESVFVPCSCGVESEHG